MTIQNILSDNRSVALPFPASTAVARGDLLYWDASAHQAKPFTSYTTGASEVLDQVAVSNLFCGIAWDSRLSSESDANALRTVLSEGIFDVDCPSQTWEIGDLVGPTWNGGSALANQAVTKVTSLHRAIGCVIKQYTSAVTKVRCRLISRKLWDLIHATRSMGGGQGRGTTALADADVTITASATAMLEMTPTANPRKLILPAEASCTGLVYWISNLAPATNAIQVRNSGDSATVVSIGATKTGIVWCNGTSWYGLVSA